MKLVGAGSCFRRLCGEVEFFTVLEPQALNRPCDYLHSARLTKLIALLWPDASQDNDSEVARPASAYSLLQLFPWIGLQVFTCGHQQKQSVPVAGLQQVRQFHAIAVLLALIHICKPHLGEPETKWSISWPFPP